MEYGLVVLLFVDKGITRKGEIRYRVLSVPFLECRELAFEK